MEYNAGLKMQGIRKRFGGVNALDGVDFTIKPGKVHALLGENGAGKSTLLKIMSGVYTADAGNIFVGGKSYKSLDPFTAQTLGIQIIHQELSLLSNLSVMENIFLGSLPRKAKMPIVNWSYCNTKARKLLDELGLDLDPAQPMASLTPAEQQMVEIAKVLGRKAHVIAMDEPTSSLDRDEADRLFKIIERLVAQGVAIIYVSHKLDEIKEIADEITILRDGKNIISAANCSLDINQIITHMVGRELDTMFPDRKHDINPEQGLDIRMLNKDKVLSNIDFSVAAGEVVGIAGLVGSGRTELARCIFGADAFDTGEIWHRGSKLEINNPREAIKQGVALIPEDRKTQGLALSLDVRENITMASLPRFSPKGILRHKDERKATQNYIKRMAIATPDAYKQVKFLSGGNQQKVVLAKWLCSQGDVFLFDEPTRGIDVGAKREVYELINELAEAGATILMISSELPEVMGMSDRILVMHDGRIAGEVGKKHFSEERLMLHATGCLVTRVACRHVPTPLKIGILALKQHGSFYDEIVSGIKKCGNNNQVYYSLIDSQEDPVSFINSLLEKNIDGLIVDDALNIGSAEKTLTNVRMFSAGYLGTSSHTNDLPKVSLGPEISEIVRLLQTNITQKLGNKQRILVMGEPKAENCTEDLFEQVKREVKRLSFTHVVAKRLQSTNHSDLLDLLKRHEITTVVACTDSTLNLVCSVGKEMRNRPYITGFAGSKQSLKYVEMGIADCIIDQFPEEYGKAVVNSICRNKTGEPLPEKVNTGHMLLTSNMLQVRQQLFSHSMHEDKTQEVI